MAHVAGKKVRLVKGEEDKATRDEARKQLRELLAFRKKNQTPESRTHTVASVIELYLQLNGQKYSSEALAQRRYYLQLFAEAHGWRAVTDRSCLPIHVEQWLADHPAWKSDWTKAQIVSIVQRPFNWAVKKRLIPSNPFRGVDQCAREPRRPLTDQEFQTLLRATSVWPKRGRYPMPHPSDVKRRQRPSSGARFRQLLVFLRFTGARPIEACLLRWADIDIAQAVIRIQRHKTSKTQRVKRPRVIPLHPVVLKLLIHIRRQREFGEFVFLNHRKTSWNRRTLGTRVRRARNLAGIPDDAKLYGLRHRFGTRSILNGVDIKTLAELMGHTSTRTTEHYLHLAGHQAHLADAMIRANGHRPAV
jgi:integrase